MDKDKQRIAIAEACGFTEIIGDRGFHQQMSDEKSKECGGRWTFPIPDYLNDLNAINDAVNYLRNANRMAYLDYGKRLDQLVAIYNSSPEQQAYHGILTCDAPADMRARAFLESLNLWTPTGEENE